MPRIVRGKVYLFGLLLTVLLLVACAGPNELINIESPEGSVAGFWSGWWHGFISPIAFIISLFNEDVSIYEVHNTGGWYDFGFVLGAGILFGGSSGTVKRKRRR